MSTKRIEQKLVFFARAMKDYGSEYEQTWIENINESFEQCKIIDFNQINEQIGNENKCNGFGNKYNRYGKKLYEVERKFFFPLIDDCDCVIAAPAWNHHRRGMFTDGVIIEIKYALSIGKKVFGVVNGEMKQITMEDLK